MIAVGVNKLYSGSFFHAHKVSCLNFQMESLLGILVLRKEG
jgi:hypothetical protein